MKFPVTYNSKEELDAAFQDRLNGELEKYKDFDTFREKAGKYDAELAKDYPGQITGLKGQIETLTEQLNGANQTIAGHGQTVAELTKRAEQAEAKALRYTVAAAKNLPLPLADRLTGTTEAELNADADALSKFVTPAAPPVAPLASTEPAGVPSNPADAGLYQVAVALGAN